MKESGRSIPFFVNGGKGGGAEQAVGRTALENVNRFSKKEVK